MSHLNVDSIIAANNAHIGDNDKIFKLQSLLWIKGSKGQKVGAKEIRHTHSAANAGGWHP